jgi:hypothetical protein
MEFDLPSTVAILERTPRTLRNMLGGLPAEWTDANEGGETWSPYVVVGHLLNGEHTNWIPRARIILEQVGDRRFEPFDRFAQSRNSEGKTLQNLLDELEIVRSENLRTLASWHLTDDHFALEGLHPEFGAVTLRQLLATWTAHDLSHLAQVSRILARQYRDAVGPWRAYLPIMEW